MLVLVVCPQFTLAASDSRVVINDKTGLVAIEGHLDYAEGVGEAYIVIPADGKSYSDFAVAITTEDFLSSVKYIGFIPVSKDGRYSASFTVENIKSDDSVYISYNGNVFLANNTEISVERKLVIKDKVVYDGENKTLDVYVLTLGHSYEEFTVAGSDVVCKSVEDVPVSEDGSFTCRISDASELMESNIIVFRYNGKDTYRKLNASEFVVSIYVDSENGNDNNSGNSVSEALKTIEKAEEAYEKMASFGFSGEIILCGGEYSGIPLNVEAPENGFLSYNGIAGEKTVISKAAKLPVSEFRKVSDADVLERLDANAASFVYQINLSEYGLTASNFEHSKFEMGMPIVYLNGKPQSIAKWPNGNYADLTLSVSDDTYSFTNNEFAKWSETAGAYLEGFFISSRPWIREYTSLIGVESDSKSIIVSAPQYSGFGDKEKAGTVNCMFTVNNLLEAIDIPGEWYVDTNTMIMYYYIPDCASDSDFVEIAYSDVSAIGSSAKDISNVSFNNLIVRGSKGKLIQFNKAENVEIKNCVLENGNFGVYLNESKNSLIENNNFRYIRGNAVHIHSGANPNTVTPSGNAIVGNHVYGCATVGTHGKDNTTVNIRIGGSQSQPQIIGDVVKNNLVHGTPYGEAIMHCGMDNDISYNEFYNLLHYVSDAGVIYNGNRLNMYGTNIHHNYIHDFTHNLRSGTGNSISAIYWDDYQSGQIAKHNIIIGGDGQNTRGLLTVGRDSTADYNLVVGAKTGMIFSDRNVNNFTEQSAYAGLSNVSEAILAKYPQIAATKKSIDEDANNHFYTTGNKAWGNMHVDVTTTASAATALSGSQKSHTLDLKTSQASNLTPQPDSYGNISGATTKSGYSDIFVDHENHDWRLKTSFISGYSEHLAQNLLTESNFSMDAIGLTDDYILYSDSDKVFSNLYPVNRTIESDGSISLVWEKALYADRYTYEVSTDTAFDQLVASGTTLHSSVEISGLSEDTNYYWRVTAHNDSKEMGDSWESISGISTFRIDNPDYKIKNIRFFDENDQEIKDMNDFGTAKYVTYDFVNGKASAEEYDFIVSLYSNSGEKLKQVLTYTKNCVGASGVNNYRAELDKPIDYSYGDLIYIFAWEKDGSIDPIAKKNVLE